MSAAESVLVEKADENNGLKALLNNTNVQKEMDCLSKELDPGGDNGESGLFCPHFYDTLLCWPKTPAGTLAVLPCFEELNGIKYDTSREYSYILLPVFYSCY
jgi:hypothetical protein